MAWAASVLFDREDGRRSPGRARDVRLSMCRLLISGAPAPVARWHARCSSGKEPDGEWSGRICGYRSDH